MARKSKPSSRRTSKPAADTPLAQSVAESAQQIWLAGLGAFSKAKTEGDKVFQALVKRGMALRGEARQAADDALKTVRSQVDAASADAQGKWDKLEQVFEQRVARAMGRLGVLTSKDVEDLAKQVAELNESVRAMMGAGARPKRRPARKAAK